MVEVDTKPVTDRISVVDARGRVTPYWLDIFRGFERAIGGPGRVNLPSSLITLPVLNELARFDADGNLEATGMLADTDLTLPADLEAVNAIFSGTANYVGKVERFEATMTDSDLAGAADVVVLPAATGEQWKVVEIMISGAGTNFSGGDRDLDIHQSTTTYSTITSTLLQALAAERWGGTGLPFPSTPGDLTTATAAGQPIVATYSGGSSDYTAGTCTIVLTAARTA